MSRRWILACGLAIAAIGGLRAQEVKDQSELLKKIDTFGLEDGKSLNAAPSPPKEAGTPKPKPAETREKGPTEITSTQEASFEDKTRKAVFVGDVRVNDPAFKLSCDKLTAFLRKEATESLTKSSPSQTTSPVKNGNGKSADAPQKGGGLERAIAEGHVVITQDKPSADGGEPVHYVGKAGKAEYDAKTGDVTLTGWPQVQSGINTQIATEESTVMIMNASGRMKTVGGSKTVIQDQGENKKTSQSP